MEMKYIRDVSGNVVLPITSANAVFDNSGNDINTSITNLQNAYAQLSGTIARKANTSNTLSGYNITDAYTKGAVDNMMAALTASNVVVVSGNLPLTGEANTIYRKQGDSSYTDNMYYNNQWITLATYNNAVDSTSIKNSSNLITSGAVYNFVGEYAIIYSGTPVLDTVNKTFTLPAGSYLFCKHAHIESTLEAVVWNKNEGEQKVFAVEYLILNTSDYSHRVVSADGGDGPSSVAGTYGLPACSDDECVIALVDWHHGIIKCNTLQYKLNSTLIDSIKFNHESSIIPVFWRSGKIEIVKDRTKSNLISVKVSENCNIVMQDTPLVSIEASNNYIDVDTQNIAFFGVVKNSTTNTYQFALRNTNNIYDDEFFVITCIYYYNQSDNRILTNINAGVLAYITYNNVTKNANLWKTLTEDEYLDSNFNISDQFLYNKKRVGYIKFLVFNETPTRAIHLGGYLTNAATDWRNIDINLIPNKKYFIVLHGYSNTYSYLILDKTYTSIITYSSSTREFTAPADGRIKIMLKKADGSEFSLQECESINNNNIYELYESDSIINSDNYLSNDGVVNLWGTAEFLDGYFYGISPYANPITYQGLTTNAAMTCCEISVKPGSKLYIQSSYIMIAYLDENKNFIDGYYFNYDAAQPTAASKISNVPWNAVYALISTRLSHKYDTVISECQFPSYQLDSYRNISPVLIPESQIVHQELNKIYDRTSFVSTASLNKLEYQGTVTINGNNELVLSGDNAGFFTKGIYTTTDRSRIGVNCKITSILDSSEYLFMFGYNASKVVGTGINDCDTIVRIFNDKLVLCKGNIASGLVTVVETANYSTNIVAGDNISIVIEKDTIYHHVVKVRKRDVIIGQIEITATVDPSDSDHELNQFRSWGSPFLISNGAAITVSRVFFYSDAPQYAKLAVVGDSYVENMSRSRTSGWVRLLEDKLGKDNIFISGQGGGSASSLITKLPIELNLCRPKYVILNTGVNDYSVATATYKERINTLIDMVKSVNAIPILITTPRVGDRDNAAWINEINPWIKSLGYKYVDIAYCLSTGDSLTMDTTRMRPDQVHPNSIGSKAILNWVESNLPEIL